MTEKVHDIHDKSRKIYGAPHVHSTSQAKGIRVDKERMARLMKAVGLVSASRREGSVTTIRDAPADLAPDLIERDFAAEKPNELWVTDITYVPADAGFLCMAVVPDMFSRRIVGRSMTDHLRTELVMQTLYVIAQKRSPKKRSTTPTRDRGSRRCTALHGRLGLLRQCHVRAVLCYARM